MSKLYQNNYFLNYFQFLIKETRKNYEKCLIIRLYKKKNGFVSGYKKNVKTQNTT